MNNMNEDHNGSSPETPDIDLDAILSESGETADKAEKAGQDKTPEENGGKKEEQFCSMCHRPESRTGKLMQLPGGLNICQDCMQKSVNAFNNSGIDLNSITRIPIGKIDLGKLNLGELGFGPKKAVKKKTPEEKAASRISMKDIPKPHRIKAMLDEYVVGQEQAKKAISVAVYNHYKRISADPKDGVEIEKSNILMLGPTGSGKTHIVRTLAKILKVPLAIADATSLTEAGYIGDDIESVLSKLLMAADSDVDRAEQGIIFIDEIDKLAKKKDSTSRDVSGESVQQELLKMLEGTRLEVPVGSAVKNPMTPTTTMDTRNILFICGGAFPELENIVKERLHRQSAMGFLGELKSDIDQQENLLLKANMDDLRAFGMIPEFLGRLPILVGLESLSKEYLVRILTEPKNAIIRQYKKLLAMDEVELSFDEDALEVIAEKALEKKTGARALRAILEEYMLDIMYEIPKDENIGRVGITKDYLLKKGGPRIEMRGQFLPEMN